MADKIFFVHKQLIYASNKCESRYTTGNSLVGNGTYIIHWILYIYETIIFVSS